MFFEEFVRLRGTGQSIREGLDKVFLFSSRSLLSVKVGHTSRGKYFGGIRTSILGTWSSREWNEFLEMSLVADFTTR